MAVGVDDGTGLCLRRLGLGTILEKGEAGRVGMGMRSKSGIRDSSMSGGRGR